MSSDNRDDPRTATGAEVQFTPTADPFSGPDWDSSPPAASEGTEPPLRRRRRVSRRRVRRRRRIGLAMLVVGGAIVICGLWVLITGLLARSQLNTVRSEIHQLRSQISEGHLAAARATASNIASHAHTAHLLTTGPFWAVSAALPDGEPFATVRGVTAQVDAVGRDALPALVSATDRIDPAKLRLPDGAFDLAEIARVAPALDTATTSIDDATIDVARLPAHTWLGSVDSARNDLLTQLQSLRSTLIAADVAARVGPQLLGANRPMRYFLAIQNNAEARGTGGLPGAFAILQAEHGHLKFLRFEPDNTLLNVPVHLHISDYAQLFGDTELDYRDSNVSANFPYAAQIWAAMWQKHSGQRVNGALAIDPQALSYLLGVAGPATLPGGEKVTAANVANLTESQVYARYPRPSDQTARKQFLVNVARAASEQIVNSPVVRTPRLLRAAGRAIGERRLLVWSADPAIERRLEQTPIAGDIPITSAPYIGLSIVNEGGNKLDYYLDRSLTWKRTGCGAQRDVIVTIRLTNNAPAGLPSYVTGFRAPRLGVGYYATAGAKMTSVSIDGKAATAAFGAERGHPVYVIDLDLPRGQTRTIVLHLREPAGNGSPIVLRQPLVRPLDVKLEDASC